jgi:hypothetical protein
MLKLFRKMRKCRLLVREAQLLEQVKFGEEIFAKAKNINGTFLADCLSARMELKSIQKKLSFYTEDCKSTHDSIRSIRGVNGSASGYIKWEQEILRKKLAEYSPSLCTIPIPSEGKEVINKLAELDVEFAVSSANLVKGLERAGEKLTLTPEIYARWLKLLADCPELPDQTITSEGIGDWLVRCADQILDLEQKLEGKDKRIAELESCIASTAEYLGDPIGGEYFALEKAASELRHQFEEAHKDTERLDAVLAMIRNFRSGCLPEGYLPTTRQAIYKATKGQNDE